MRVPRIAVRVWMIMIAVVIAATIFAGVSLYRRTQVVLAAVLNYGHAPITEVVVVYRGRAWKAPRLAHNEFLPMGVYSLGRTEVGLSYTDDAGQRIEARVVIGVNLDDAFSDATAPMGWVTIRTQPTGPVSVREL